MVLVDVLAMELLLPPAVIASTSVLLVASERGGITPESAGPLRVEALIETEVNVTIQMREVSSALVNARQK